MKIFNYTDIDLHKTQQGCDLQWNFSQKLLTQVGSLLQSITKIKISDASIHHLANECASHTIDSMTAWRQRSYTRLVLCLIFLCMLRLFLNSKSRLFTLSLAAHCDYSKKKTSSQKHTTHQNSKFLSVSICSQPYRTTPLILPGAKSNIHKSFTTESYLRHHPNPNMRGSLNGDTTDALMKQKLADSVLNVNSFSTLILPILPQFSHVLIEIKNSFFSLLRVSASLFAPKNNFTARCWWKSSSSQ